MLIIVVTKPSFDDLTQRIYLGNITLCSERGEFSYSVLCLVQMYDKSLIVMNVIPSMHVYMRCDISFVPAHHIHGNYSTLSVGWSSYNLVIISCSEYVKEIYVFECYFALIVTVYIYICMCVMVRSGSYCKYACLNLRKFLLPVFKSACRNGRHFNYSDMRDSTSSCGKLKAHLRHQARSCN